MREEVAIEGSDGLGFGRTWTVGGDESFYSWGMTIGHAILGEPGEDGFHKLADHGEFEEELRQGRV